MYDEFRSQDCVGPAHSLVSCDMPDMRHVYYFNGMIPNELLATRELSWII